MAMTGKALELKELLEPTVTSLGLELLGIEFSPAACNTLLRLYIDAPGRLVAIEDCEAVSREVSANLDVNDPIASNYTLEVSSPGIDRPIFSLAQFAKWIGEQAKISLNLPQDGRRRLQGVIQSVGDDGVALLVDGRVFTVSISNVDKARLVPDLVALGLVAEPKGGRRKTAPDKH
jgi:ribosome maturation factor RimP